MSLTRLICGTRCTLCRRVLDPRGAGRARICPACAVMVRQQYRAPGGLFLPGCSGSDAVLLYTGMVRRAIIRMKFLLARGNHIWLGAELAAGLARHLEDWRPDLVTYVPSPLNHWWGRGFNPARLLAQDAASACGLDCLPTLSTAWFAGYQSNRSMAARRKAAAGRYHPKAGAPVEGKRVVLIDDVWTTGATATDCVRCLREMGAAEVYVLCLAKTPGNHKKVTKIR